jgi:glycosyltransferase involved in cell wall biosynthesis
MEIVRSAQARSHRAHILDAIDRKVSSNAPIIAVVGNLREVKQPMLAVRVAAGVAERLSTAVILALFGRDDEGWIQRMRCEVTNSAVALAPMGFRYPIGEWLGSCDALLATSSGDAFGRAVVEAMSAGVPVVATQIGGHLEIVTHMVDGLLAPGGDVGQMVKAVVGVLNEPQLRNKLIAGGYERSLDFSARRHAQQMAQLYCEATRKLPL